MLADVVGLASAFLLTESLFLHSGALISEIGVGTETLVFLATLPLWLMAASLYGLYDGDGQRTDHSTVDELVSVFHLITVGVWSFFALSWILGLTSPSQAKLAAFWALTIVCMATSRSLARAFFRRSSAYVQNTVIVGAGDVGQLIGRKLLQHPEYGINLVGFVDAEPKSFRNDLEGLEVLGDPEDLSTIVARFGIDRAIIAFSNDRHDQSLELIRSLRSVGVQVDLVPRLFEAVGPEFGIHDVEGLPLVGLPPAKEARASRLLKRVIDLVGAVLALIVTAPLFAAIAVMIKRDSPGPVFFRQRRLGMEMREFTLLKFRTMKVDTDDGPHRAYIKEIMDVGAAPTSNKLYKLERPEAVTKVGAWLRRTSLDELPQLINVIRGEMSLVGPRPCIPYETELFEPHHFERFLVPAGITGLWQVAARAHSTFREALDLDVAYAQSWSLWLDLRLVCRTPFRLLRGRETS